LTARWVFPVEGPPLERGTVSVRGERVEAVEPHGRRSADLDLGNAAILPGLVNAHTHLDLGGLRGRCPPQADFTAWLRAVIGHRRNSTPEQIEAAIRAGVAESLAFGTTLLGDVSGQGLSWPILAASPLRAVVFRELLGLSRARAEQAAAVARDWLEAQPARGGCRPGLSPHAPYSVHRLLFQTAGEAAQKYGAPLAVHLAETPAELELLQHRRGPFVPFLQELGVWDEEGLTRGAGHVLRLVKAARPLLVVHGNYLPAGSALPRGSTVVYCPRTHAAFGHAPHPFRDLLRQGVRVALATDSLASSPDLDMLAEARHARRAFPDVCGHALLRTITLSGAEALGWQDETGSLAPGKSADLVVLRLPDEEPTHPHALIFDSALPVEAVLCRGRWARPPVERPA
jgi:cytosine/adenosine deaminase-related metal-dependent hydrolase